MRFLFTFAFLLICCFAAQAQTRTFVSGTGSDAKMLIGALSPSLATRTFVSGTGSDANPCTRVSPCRSFQHAHDLVAAGGEVIALDSAGYGPITIDKSVSIIGDGNYAGINTSFGDGVTIATAGITVNLRSLTINGLGTGTNGINVTSVSTLHVEGCVISGFIATDIFSSSGNGIRVALTADRSHIFIKDTITRNNSHNGIFITTSTGTVRASIDNCRSERNGIGFFASNNSRVTINRSVASGNDLGFTVFSGVSGAPAELSCEECVASNNETGFQVNALSGGAATIRVSHSTATNNNTIGFRQLDGVFESLGNNLVAGNGTETSGTITVITAK
jgi:hypothetical protein